MVVGIEKIFHEKIFSVGKHLQSMVVKLVGQ